MVANAITDCPYFRSTFVHTPATDYDALITERQLGWRDEALEEWKEIRTMLSPQLAQQVEDFVQLSDESGVYFCSPGCSVDLLEDGSVMFDWNDGTLPIFTVMITVNMEVVHVGHFADGKIKGEGRGLSIVGMHLERFVREREGNPWNIIVSLDSFVKKNAVVLGTGLEPLFTRHPLEETSLYSDVITPMDETWLDQENMLPND